MKIPFFGLVAVISILPAAQLKAADTVLTGDKPDVITTSWGAVQAPAYPETICATLQARFVSSSGRLDRVDEPGRPSQPDQERLQAAIDHCGTGAVKLVPGAQGQDGFLTGPVTLKSHVILWIDKGVTLFASRNPKDYDTGPGDCGTANTVSKKSCLSLITAPHSDGAAIMGEGTIDGRGGSLLTGGPNAAKASWWDLAWLTKSGLVQHNFRLIQIDDARNFVLRDIHLLNSPNFHIVTNDVDGVTAWGITILSPSLAYSVPDYNCADGTRPDQTAPATCFTPDTIKNTDGFDPGQSQHVVLAHSLISVGDDQVAIKAHGHPVMRDMVLAHNVFYYGHGLSIGSETDAGADNIVSYDLVMDGMDSPNGNGLRIKSDTSRGGRVTRVAFIDTCMRNVRFPVVLDTAYSDKTGTLIPDFADVTIKGFVYTGSHAYGGGRWVLRGYGEGSTHHPVSLGLSNAVSVPSPTLSGDHGHADVPPREITARLETVDAGLRSGFSALSGADVQVKDQGGSPDLTGAIARCEARFHPMKSYYPAAPF